MQEQLLDHSDAATDEMVFVPDAPAITSVVHSEEEVRAKWPKLVQSITSLRSQLASVFNSSTTSTAVEFAEILSVFDNKLLRFFNSSQTFGSKQSKNLQK
jgi:hypothetical protein